MGYVKNIQHLENIYKFLIIYDVEWSVSENTPHCKEILKMCCQVHYTIGEGLYLLRFQNIGWLTTSLMFEQIFHGVFKAGLSQGHA